MTEDDVAGTLRLTDDDGHFDLPDRYAEARQMVIRTPAITANMPSCGMIEEFWFDPRPDRNPELAPDKVSLKIYGEDPEIYRIENPERADVPDDFET